MSNDERKTTVEGSINAGFLYVGGDFVGRDKYETHHHYPPPEPTAPKFLLPKRPEYFTGRSKALAWIKEHLYPTKHLTIIGTGGLGKTAVANEALHQLFEERELQKRFPAGVIFHTFYQKPRLADAYATILEAVGQKPPAKFEEMERAVQLVLQGQPLLLVLDGAEQAVDLPSILKLSGQAGVLVSTRQPSQAGALRYPLEKLPVDEAAQLLQAWGQEYAQPQQVVEQLCVGVDNLPLAVRLIGHYLAASHEPAGEYLRWFEQAKMEALHQGSHQEESVPLLLARSVGRLSEESRPLLYLFRYLANAPVPLPALQAALGCKERQLRSWLKEMVDYSLLERTENGRVQPIHALIYQWVRESGSVEAEVLTRLAEYWTEQGKAAEKQGAELFASLHGLSPHWLELIQLASAQNLPQLAYDLINGVDRYLNFQAHSAEHLLFRQLSVQMAKQLNSPHNKAYALRRLGEVHYRGAEYGLARERIEETRLIYAKIEDRLGEANCILRLGDMHLRVSEYGLAQERYEEARPIFAQIGDRLGEANCIKSLGDVYLWVAEYGLARERYEEARPIFTQIGNRLGEANIIQSLGHVHRMLSEYRLARERYEQARLIYAHIGNRLGEASCIKSLGDLHQMGAEYGLARERYEEARYIFVQIGDRLGEANCIRSLGVVHQIVAEYGLARERYEEARHIFVQIGDRQGEANCIRDLGIVHWMVVEYGLAKERYEEAQPIFAEIGDRLGEANCILSLGDVYRMVAEYGLARERYEEARPIFAQIGNRLGEASCIKALGHVYYVLDEYGLARERYEEAWPIFAEIGDRLEEANCIQALGQLYRTQKQYEQAENQYLKAQLIFQEIGDIYSYATSGAYLGLLARDKGDVALARQRLQEAVNHFAKFNPAVAQQVQGWLDKLPS